MEPFCYARNFATIVFQASIELLGTEMEALAGVGGVEIKGGHGQIDIRARIQPEVVISSWSRPNIRLFVVFMLL